jgi:hypothetical protein
VAELIVLLILPLVVLLADENYASFYTESKETIVETIEWDDESDDSSHSRAYNSVWRYRN